jgi:hypothetical protein
MPSVLSIFTVVLVLGIVGVVVYTRYVDRYVDLDVGDDRANRVVRIRTFDDIRHVVYLNLAHRVDRRNETEAELKELGWKPIRIDAVKYDPGPTGCTLSHIKALEYAKSQKWSHVLVCEDDVHFDRPVAEIRSQLDTFFTTHRDWDVVSFGCGPKAESKVIDATCIQIRDAVLSHCYLVRSEYYDMLLHNLRGSLHEVALDIFWQSLQARDRWLLPVPVIAVQRYSRSDNTGDEVEHTDSIRQNVQALLDGVHG